jgi:hypothetical protein
MVDILETVDGREAIAQEGQPKPAAHLLPLQEKSLRQGESELVAGYWHCVIF